MGHEPERPLERFDDVEALAKRLHYVVGF